MSALGIGSAPVDVGHLPAEECWVKQLVSQNTAPALSEDPTMMLRHAALGGIELNPHYDAAAVRCESY